MWSSCPWVSTMATTSSSRSRIEVKSGRITSIPGWWSSGKRTPQSTTSSLPWYSKTVMLRPISPRPPRGVTRRAPRARRGGDFRILVLAGCTMSILPESGPIGPDSGRIDLVHPAQTKNLKSPPRLARGVLRVTPLGGLGEIGRNMTVFEYQGKLLVVDCGVLFPEDHQQLALVLEDRHVAADLAQPAQGGHAQDAAREAGRGLQVLGLGWVHEVNPP